MYFEVSPFEFRNIFFLQFAENNSSYCQGIEKSIDFIAVRCETKSQKGSHFLPFFNFSFSDIKILLEREKYVEIVEKCDENSNAHNNYSH